MRKKIVAANWKMNMTTREAEMFIKSFRHEIGEEDDIDIVIVPPFTALAQTNELLSNVTNIKLGAQNMHWEKSGAYTGEISAAMLRDLYVRYVILGHSERRALFGESDEIVNRKVRAAHAAGLRVILCVGETLEQRDAGQVEAVLEQQLRAGLEGLDPKEIQETVIAYEPVWAIGTGRTASPEQAQEAHAFIRRTIAAITSAEVAERVRIQYGGSVKPENAPTLLHQPDIDGALVGGAALDPRAFAQIVKAGLSPK